MEELNTYIHQVDYSGIRNYFMERGERLTLGKKEYFQRQHEQSRYAAYVQEGLFHYTCTGDDGKEHIVGYSFATEFICDYASFVKGTNSLTSIRALADSTLYVLSFKEYLTYADSTQNGFHFGYQVANGLFEMYYKRLLETYCDTPEKRYVKLMEKCPALKEMVSLKEIASFLGVTPETVSHIRKKLLND